MQDVIYNAYLKGNGIQSGTKNYDEVLSLLMTDFKIKEIHKQARDGAYVNQ